MSASAIAMSPSPAPPERRASSRHLRGQGNDARRSHALASVGGSWPCRLPILCHCTGRRSLGHRGLRGRIVDRFLSSRASHLGTHARHSEGARARPLVREHRRWRRADGCGASCGPSNRTCSRSRRDEPDLIIGPRRGADDLPRASSCCPEMVCRRIRTDLAAEEICRPGGHSGCGRTHSGGLRHGIELRCGPASETDGQCHAPG